jgi:hypothetical protein
MPRSMRRPGLGDRQQARALVAEPGFMLVMPGSGVIMIAPVSVCHQVSTIGQRSPPMCGDTTSRLRG